MRIYQALGRPAMSLRTCYRRIREQGVWRRPRLIAKGDPDHDTICADIREQVTALPAGSVVLAEDETHLDLIARIRACWMPHGLRHRVLTPGTNQRRTLHGAVNLVTGAWHHHVSIYNVSVVFCYFLEQLLAAYPHAPVVAVICDNGTTHHSGITRRWLADNPRLLLIPGARYSPQDNPVERMWAALKHHLANTAPATMANRVQQAHVFFRHRTPTQNLTTAAPWTSPWLPEGYGQDHWPGALDAGARPSAEPPTSHLPTGRRSMRTSPGRLRRPRGCFWRRPSALCCARNMPCRRPRPGWGTQLST